MLSQVDLSRWIGAALPLALAAALLLPSAARAVPPAVVSFGGGVGNVNATTGSEDELVVSAAGNFFRVNAPTSKVISGGPPCSGVISQTFVVCPTGAGVLRIAVNLGNKDDTVTLSLVPATVTSTLNGGRGDDRVTGGPGADAIIAGRGQDVARGGPGNDNLNMRDGSRDVRIDCGAGTDRAKLDRRDPRARNCERISRR